MMTSVCSKQPQISKNKMKHGNRTFDKRSHCSSKYSFIFLTICYNPSLSNDLKYWKTILISFIPAAVILNLNLLYREIVFKCYL